MAIFDVPMPPPITPFEMQGLQDLQQLVALKELEFDSLQKDYDRCEGREEECDKRASAVDRTIDG